MKPSKVPAALAIVSLFLLLPSPGGSAETWVEMNSSVGNDLHALWGTSDWDIFAAGASGRILRYTENDTLTWTPMNTDAYSLYGLNSLWGATSSDVYAAGGQGQLGGIILRNTGGPWGIAATVEVTILYGMWGSSPSNVYAVGELGSIYAYNGNDWASLESPTDLTLYSIWGSASDDIYIGGELGSIYRYHDGTWVQAADGLTTRDVRALWGSSASDVFASCDNGVILHYDGTAWEVQDTGTGLNLSSIWGSSGDDVFAAGENGIILKYDSETGTWSTLDPGIAIADDLRAIWGSTAGSVYFAGDNGTIVRLQRDDTIAPKVVSTGLLTLNDGKAYVTTQVVFHFSEEMDEASLNPETIILTRGTTAIPGTVTVSDDHRSATFTPSDSLAYSRDYTATVKGGSGVVVAKDAAIPDKNAMAADYTLSFTTEDAPGSGGSDGGGCFIMSARP